MDRYDIKQPFHRMFTLSSAGTITGLLCDAFPNDSSHTRADRSPTRNFNADRPSSHLDLDQLGFNPKRSTEQYA